MSHYQPVNLSDRVALSFTKSMRFFADTFFQKRYGHRAVVLGEGVAAVDLTGDQVIRGIRGQDYATGQ